MLLSVVTVTHNSAGVLPTFLEGLGELAPESVEIIVVDSGSADLPQVERAVERVGGVLVAAPDNVGYGFGSNLGARLASGTWVAFVNPDVTVSAGDLLRLVEVARSHGLSVVGPTLRNAVGEAPPSARPLIEPLWRRPSWEFPEDGSVVLAPSMSGCCMVVRADRFREIGGFDPRYFMFAEETDLHLRLRESGDAVGVSREIVAYTEGGGSSEGVTSSWAVVQRCVSRVVYSFTNLSVPAGIVDLGWRVLQLLSGRDAPRRAALSQFSRELLRTRRLARRDPETYVRTVRVQDHRPTSGTTQAAG
ncbi:glycosyltransferase family 2 protein [Aeromicrobium duanguangcaii]|uniref:Glycosyltransferase family 2 protein n=1 Tax=Aeromicrobium duanguangcaii TaxID=2968086 RepID=A0ABY5KDL5_9ACTN|nr:glycosyltransferase family 2 protein [Aeromicrobium duanguangcaii]MCD9154524.1 glycosyltransferase family 2 protein [Aeromicrobium duanguangcaii]UUI68420.1 glycosyltransferase family 2 protein [Aeromicrobium duanguangcaii]